MLVMFVGWKLCKRSKFVSLSAMDLLTDRYNLVHMQGTENDGNHGDDERRDGNGVVSSGRHEKGVFGKVKRVGMWLFL